MKARDALVGIGRIAFRVVQGRIGHGDGAPGRSPIEIGHTRLIVTASMFVLAFLTISARLVDVTLISGAEPRVARAPRVLPIERADIVDRNGVLLATSVSTASLFGEPHKVIDPVGAAHALAQVLPDVGEDVLRSRLTSDKSFVYLRRNLTPRQEYEVNRLGIPGLGFQREDRRIYPEGSTLAHVLGFSDIDNHGLAGIERSFDQSLRAGGEPLQLSIDIRLQQMVREELAAAVQKFTAIGGAGMVMDARSGEVLAMVSLPDFDPNHPGTATDAARFNRNTLGVYEMGSVFKIFNTAMTLEAGTATLTSSYDASHPLQIGRFAIHDDHAQNRWLSVPEVFIYSSNIGSARMALEVGPAGQRAFFDKLGMLRPAKIELPEIGHPEIPMQWRPINTMTIAFGHGMAVSPVQLIGGVATVLGGGTLVRPTLLKQNGPVTPGEQVISAKTSLSMRRLMRLNVEDPRGTGKFGAVPGYLVGGKTGTAEKAAAGGYRHKALLSTFLAVFPMTSPRYVVQIMIDEPHGTKDTYGFATAAWVAAPSVKRIIERMGPMFGVPTINENSDEVRRAMAIDVPRGAARVAAR
jgi:cell division protein FtsI (penicillin-binding protein 3)